MDLIEFYKGMVQSLELVVDDHDRVMYERLTGLEPVTIRQDGKDKILVLPTSTVLRTPDWDTFIAFHPLSENIARKDSVVFQALQRFASLSLNVDIGALMGRMIEYCADKDSHKTMNHKQTKFLQLFPDADETSLKNWEKLDAKLGEEYVYTRIVTLRDKELEGQTFPRVTYVKFPFYEDCVKLTEGKHKEYSIFGVKLRKKDVLGYKALFEFLVHHASEPDSYYSFGSRSNIAPSFHSLASAMYKLKAELQRTYRLLKIDTPELLWGQYLDKLQQFKGQVPVLQGNDGELTEGERRRQEYAVKPVTTPAPAAKVPVIQQQPINSPVPAAPPVTAQLTQPVQQTVNPAPQPTKSGKNGIPVISFNPQPQQVAQPMYPQQPMYQQQYIQQPMVNQMQPVQQPQQVVNQPYMGQQVVYQQPMMQPQMQMQRPVDMNGRPINVWQSAPQMAVQPYMGQPAVWGQPMQPQMWGQPQWGNRSGW